MYRLGKRALRLALCIPLIVLILHEARPAYSSAPLYTRKERFGIAFVSQVPIGRVGEDLTQSLSDYRLVPLQVGWYSDWKYSATPAQPADTTLEYVQVINVTRANWPPNWDGSVRNTAIHNPGALWIIGNEPEGPFQANLTPSTYADTYHEAYTNLKRLDPTARVAIGGVIEPTPMRLHWLEDVWTIYRTRYGVDMPVDVWNIHMQILVETGVGAGIPTGITPTASETAYTQGWDLPDSADVDKFKRLVTEFRTWMKNHGQQNKQLIISEMGVLFPSEYLCSGDSECGDQRIEQFMRQAFDWLLQATDANTGCPADENRLVQRWLWFSLNDSFWVDTERDDSFNGSLYDYRSKGPTRFGRVWIAYQGSEPFRLMLPWTNR
jgi:hypothetical protein